MGLTPLLLLTQNGATRVVLERAIALLEQARNQKCCLCCVCWPYESLSTTRRWSRGFNRGLASCMIFGREFSHVQGIGQRGRGPPLLDYFAMGINSAYA